MLTRVFRLLTLLLVACPVVMAMVVFDTPSAPVRVAVIGVGATPIVDDTPQLTRLGNETDDLREAVFGSVLRSKPVQRTLAVFAPRHTDRIETLRDPPPDRPPRAIG